METKVLITGGRGYLGVSLQNYLRNLDIPFVVGTRDSENMLGGEVAIDYTSEKSIKAALTDVTHIAHLASVAHTKAPASAYRDGIVKATEMLAKQALGAGVRRFLYASSIKAFGEGAAKTLNEDSPCCPITSYGVAKLEAELILREVFGEQSPKINIVRFPPLYGGQEKGSIKYLRAAARLGVPLPLGGAVNKRTLLSVTKAAQLVGELLMDGGPTLICPHESAVTPLALYSNLCECVGRDGPPLLSKLGFGSWFYQLLANTSLIGPLFQSFEVSSKYRSKYSHILDS